MLKLQDRVKELTTTLGTGSLSLSGTAEAGFQAFSVLGNGTKTYYTITDVNGTDFEVGEGTYNANTLTRDTIFESSNSGNAISLSATGSTVFVTYPAEKSSYRDIGVNRDYTASGSITAGKPLILNADNTVSQVAETTSTIPAGLGTNSSIAISSSVYDQQVSMGATNQFISLYTFANDTKCYLTPNTISSDLKTITSGVETNFDTGAERNIGIIYEPNQGKYVAFHVNSNQYPCATVLDFVGSGSTATISIGTTTVLDSNTIQFGFDNDKLTYDTSAQKFILSFARTNSSGWTISSSLSGSTITAGTAIAVPMYGSYLNAGNITCSYSSTADKTVYLYADNNTEDLYTTVGTVSGSSFSFGSTAIVGSLPTGNFNGADACVGVDNNGVVVLSYLAQDITPAYTLFSQAGTLSGTTITWGSPSQVSNVTCLNNAQNECSIESIASGKMIITRATRSDSPSNADDGIFVIVTSSGTTVTNGSVQTFSTSATRYPSVSTNYSKTQAVINYGDASSMDVNNIVYLESQQTGGVVSNLLTDNYFGIASTTASTTEPVGVNRAGSFNNDQTGMTAGKDYYAKNDGTIVERTSAIPNTTPSSTDFITYASSQIGNSIKTSIAYDTTNDKIGVLNYGTGGSDYYPRLTIGTESGSSITWGTPVIVYSGNGGNERGYQLTYGNGAFIGTYATSSKGYVFGATYTGTNSATIGTRVQPFSGDLYRENTTISYNPNENKFVFIAKELNTTDFKLYIITNSGTTLTVGNSATLSVTANTYSHWFNGYDPDTHRTVIAISYLSGSGNDKIYTANISGSNITASTNYLSVGYANFSEGNQSMNYDPDNNKWLYLDIDDDSTDQNIYATVLTASSDTFTKGTRTLMNSVKSRYMASYYDTEQNKSVVPYQLYDTSASEYYGKIGVITISGTTPSWTDSTNIIGNTTTDRTKPQASLFNPDTNKGVVIADRQTNNEGVSALLSFGSTITVNASQFVGTARSGTDLELSETPTELVGMANGSITKGDAVLLRTDGDFTKVISSGGTVSEIKQFTSTQAGGGDSLPSGSAISSGSDGNGTICFVYLSTSNYPMLQLATTDSSGNITYGTKHTIWSQTFNYRHAGIDYDPNFNDGVGAFIITAQYNAGSSSYVWAFTFSGTTPTYADEDAYTSGSSFCNTLYNAYDTTNQQTYVWMSDPYSSLNTITNTSGSTLGKGTVQYPFGSASTRMDFGNMIYDNTNNRGTIFYKDTGNSSYPTAMGYTVSGTTFTFGTATVLESSACSYIGGAEGEADGNGTICTWQNGSNTDFKYVNLTYSGLTISLSGVTTFLNNSYVYPFQHITYNKNAKKYVAIVYRTSSLDNPQAIVGTPSSGSVGWGSAITLPIASGTTWSVAIISETGKDAQNLYLGYSNVGEIQAGIYASSYSNFSTNITANNFIGFAQDTVADNEDVKVATIGQTDDNQSSLTTATQYFVNNSTGALQTTADTISVVGGTALSSTKILIKS